MRVNPTAATASFLAATGGSDFVGVVYVYFVTLPNADAEVTLVVETYVLADADPALIAWRQR